MLFGDPTVRGKKNFSFLLDLSVYRDGVRMHANCVNTAWIVIARSNTPYLRRWVTMGVRNDQKIFLGPIHSATPSSGLLQFFGGFGLVSVYVVLRKTTRLGGSFTKFGCADEVRGVGLADFRCCCCDTFCPRWSRPNRNVHRGDGNFFFGVRGFMSFTGAWSEGRIFVSLLSWT